MKNNINNNEKTIKKLNIKIIVIRIILIIMLFATFGIIFGFSNQNAEKSSSISRKITIAITKNIKAIQEKPEKEKARIISRIEKVVRKLAHFSIYTVVGILLMFLFETFSMEEINRFSISLIIGVIYASSDEIHQCFTPRKRSTNYRCYFR